MSNYYYTNPGPSGPGYDPRMNTAPMQAPVYPGLIALKETFGSWPCLLAAISVLLSAAGVLMTLFSPSLSTLPSLTISSLVTTYSRIFLVIHLLFLILVFIGLFLMYTSSRAGYMPVNTAGFTIGKVYSYIKTVELILTAILCTLSAISLSIVILTGAVSDSMGFDIPGLSQLPRLTMRSLMWLLVVVVVFSIFLVVYYIQLAKVFNNASGIARTGYISFSISYFVPVCSLLMTFFYMAVLVYDVYSLSLYHFSSAAAASSILIACGNAFTALFNTILYFKVKKQFDLLSIYTWKVGRM